MLPDVGSWKVLDIESLGFSGCWMLIFGSFRTSSWQGGPHPVAQKAEVLRVAESSGERYPLPEGEGRGDGEQARDPNRLTKSKCA